MGRKLFCEISPFTYKISVFKNRLVRWIKWIIHGSQYARNRQSESLEVVVYQHKSLIRRKLGNVDMTLQENKTINLSLAAPKVNQIIIRPGETFSFWRLVGSCTKAKGYKEGLMIKKGGVDSGIGGGMCQFTNLLHWLVLHSPLKVVEHHHHNQIDMFPDYGRQVPFGSGTSIMYNYLDYQFKNDTDQIFQLVTYTTDEHLCGELRCEKPLEQAYHVVEKESYFIKEGADYYRHNEIYKKEIDKKTGNTLQEELIVTNHAKVLYDADFIPEDKMRVS